MSNGQLETGTTSFLDRAALTQRLEEALDQFFKDHGFDIYPFGQEVIIPDSTWLRSKMRRVASKSNLAAVRVKFTPDFLVVRKDSPDTVFYMDAKASITPVFFGSQITRIRDHYKKDIHLSRHDIGEIEREAWFSYNRFYPSDSVAIVLASPYNPKVLLAEWASRIECMWCLKVARPGSDGGPIPWDCEACPTRSTKKGGFGVLVNEFAGGSGTPHTNIHFGSMRTLAQFMREEFAVDIDQEEYEYVMVDPIKAWPLNKPRGRVNWSQFNNAVRDMRGKCPWLKCRNRDGEFPCEDDAPKLL